MIGPLDAIYIDDRDAFPIEECVAKMIGWMQGFERLHYILMDEYGVPPDKLAHLPNLVYTLKEHLDQLKERARLELEQAFVAFNNAEEGTPEKITLHKLFNEKEDYVAQYSELMKKAYFYRSEINKELDKGELSILKIVQSASDAKNVLHISLESLDEWAKKYGINIIEAPQSISVDDIKLKDQVLNENKPWLIPHHDDSDPAEPWYIPARYFARLLVKEFPHLEKRRDLLAEKVVDKLTKHSFLKRGEKKPLQPSTVLKSFSNIKLS